MMSFGIPPVDSGKLTAKGKALLRRHAGKGPYDDLDFVEAVMAEEARTGKEIPDESWGQFYKQARWNGFSDELEKISGTKARILRVGAKARKLYGRWLRSGGPRPEKLQKIEKDLVKLYRRRNVRMAKPGYEPGW